MVDWIRVLAVQMEKRQAGFEIYFEIYKMIDRTCWWIDVGGKASLPDF